MRNLQLMVKKSMESCGLMEFESGRVRALCMDTQMEEVLEMEKNIRLFECKMKSLFRKF